LPFLFFERVLPCRDFFHPPPILPPLSLGFGVQSAVLLLKLQSSLPTCGFTRKSNQRLAFCLLFSVERFGSISFSGVVPFHGESNRRSFFLVSAVRQRLPRPNLSIHDRDTNEGVRDRLMPTPFPPGHRVHRIRFLVGLFRRSGFAWSFCF